MDRVANMSRLRNECASSAPSNIPSTISKSKPTPTQQVFGARQLAASIDLNTCNRAGTEWPWASTKPLEQKQNVETSFEDQIKSIDPIQSIKSNQLNSNLKTQVLDEYK